MSFRGTLACTATVVVWSVYKQSKADINTKHHHLTNLTGTDTGQKHEYNHDTLMRVSRHGWDQPTRKRPYGKARIYNSLQGNDEFIGSRAGEHPYPISAGLTDGHSLQHKQTVDFISAKFPKEIRALTAAQLTTIWPPNTGIRNRPAWIGL